LAFPFIKNPLKNKKVILSLVLLQEAQI